MKKKIILQKMVLVIVIVLTLVFCAATIIVADTINQPVQVNTNALPFCR
jgi:hypothetical protein